MGETLTKIMAPLGQFWKNLSPKAKKLIVAAIIAAGLAALAVSFVLNNSEEYVTIFDELPQSETTEIWAQLQSMGIKAKSDSTGRIMVPARDEANVRMQLATAGYPKNGLNYYLIEQNNSMLTTDYQRKLTENMQLQERIAASIKTLDGVRDAVVTITIPPENVFYLKQDNLPSASVIVHMKQGSTLNSKQIAGIQNLVAKSVTGLLPENIALIDGQGNDLIGNSLSGDGQGLDMARQMENDIRQKIVSVLMGPYRPEEVRVAVSAVINLDSQLSEELTYVPSPDGNNSGVISEESSSTGSSSSTTGDGGVPGTDTNSEVPTYPTGGQSGTSESSSSDTSTKYDVSSKKTQTMRNSPQIESISIGIAVDRTSFAPGEEANIIKLAAAAANVAETDVSVVNFPFYSDQLPEQPESTETGIPSLYIILGAIAGGLILLTLIILLLVSSRNKKRRKAEEEAAAAAAALAAAEADELIEYDEEGFPITPSKSGEIGPIAPMRDKRREEIQEFARSNPEITAQMIKTLLKAEES